MTLNPATSHDTSTAITPQQHHAQAAEHLEVAVKAHKEAAKLIAANDHKGSEAQAKIAHDHTAKAKEHMLACAKKSVAVSH